MSDEYTAVIQHDGSGLLMAPWNVTIWRGNSVAAKAYSVAFTEWGAKRWAQREVSRFQAKKYDAKKVSLRNRDENSRG